LIEVAKKSMAHIVQRALARGGSARLGEAGKHQTASLIVSSA
jgi:hypothetical protein